MGDRKPYTIEDVIKYLEKADKSQNEQNTQDTMLTDKTFQKKIKCWWNRRDDKYAMSRQDYIDCEMMLTNLKILKLFADSDEKRVEFAKFFESALVGSFKRYRSSKKKTWGMTQNALLLLAAPVIPALSGALVALFSSDEGVLVGAPLPVIMAAAVIGVMATSYTKWHEMKNDKETWVRHSVCYNRLNLLLQQFILSKRSDVDYDSFVQNTFSILDQNLDQFALNMSGNGLAERPELQPKKDD